jgi:hypothetical protein
MDTQKIALLTSGWSLRKGSSARFSKLTLMLSFVHPSNQSNMSTSMLTKEVTWQLIERHGITRINEVQAFITGCYISTNEDV